MMIYGPEDDRNDMLIKAAIRGIPQQVIDLLEQGANIEHTNQFGKPLAAASLMRKAGTVKVLLTYGACVNKELLDFIKERKDVNERYLKILTLLQDAKVLQDLVDELIAAFIEQVKLSDEDKKTFKQELFNHLYPHLQDIKEWTLEESSRSALIKDIIQQLIQQNGNVTPNTNLFEAINVHKFFMLREIMRNNNADVKELTMHFLPAFLSTISPAANEPGEVKEEVKSKEQILSPL